MRINTLYTGIVGSDPKKKIIIRV